LIERPEGRRLNERPTTLRSLRSWRSVCAHARFDRSRGWAPSATEPQWPRINRICRQSICSSCGHHWRIRPASGVVSAFAARVTTPLRSVVTRAAYRRGTPRARPGLAWPGTRLCWNLSCVRRFGRTRSADLASSHCDFPVVTVAYAQICAESARSYAPIGAHASPNCARISGAESPRTKRCCSGAKCWRLRRRRTKPRHDYAQFSLPASDARHYSAAMDTRDASGSRAERSAETGSARCEFGCRLISRKQLLAMVPLSDRTIYNLEKRGEFPRRIVLTRRNVAWDLAEVEDWIESRRRSGARIPAPGLRPPSR
jgi:prophage regulatory protein